MKQKNKLVTNIIITILCGITYLALSLPLRDILSVFTVTEVRPAAVLNPFLGICFGLPAAIGIMLGNCLADAISGYSVAVLIEGLVPQFLYTYVPYLMWHALNKNENHIHRLDSVKRVLRFALTIFIYALISGLGVATIVQVNFHADFINCAFFTFLNNLTMGMVLGCPLMILANLNAAKLHNNIRQISVNEKLIIFAAIIEFIIVCIIALFVYKQRSGTYDVWNTVFIYSCIAIFVFMILTLFVMKIVEEKENKKAIV